MGSAVACGADVTEHRRRPVTKRVAAPKGRCSRVLVQTLPKLQEEHLSTHEAACTAAQYPDLWNAVPREGEHNAECRRVEVSALKVSDSDGTATRGRALSHHLQHGADIRSFFGGANESPPTCATDWMGLTELDERETNRTLSTAANVQMTATGSAVNNVFQDFIPNSPVPQVVATTLTDEDYGFRNIDDVNRSGADVGSTHANAAADRINSLPSVTSSEENAEEDGNNPWQLYTTDTICTPDATPASGAIAGSKRASRVAVSTSPRIFSPPPGSGDSETTSAGSEGRATSPNVDPLAAKPRAEYTKPPHERAGETVRCSQDSTAKLRFPVGFFDRYSKGANCSPATMPQEGHTWQSPVGSSERPLSPFLETHTTTDVSSTANSASEEGREWSNANPQPRTTWTNPTENVAGAVRHCPPRCRSTTPTMSPVVTSQTVTAVAESSTQTAEVAPSLKHVRSSNTVRTIPRSVAKNLFHPPPRRIPSAPLVRSDSLSPAWPPEKTFTSSSPTPSTVIAPERHRKSFKTAMSPPAPPPRQQQQQQLDAVLKASRQAQTGSDPSTESQISGSVSFVLAEDQARLAMLSSQRLSLAQPRHDYD
ncbi:hypothetical protein ABL78_3756 [Leptomonas seymouri]|uniref:Uncharacterized protein n=1 Tax=Leptomonas seymouri TaxID=5684 RepID=A0A0N1PBM6_LEPSE|nr:hypothetical protein ABL78_3756 [Leptomonas seymouri]|eukprot:KPI87154.1 hypothetical protein ABL78_3756 [Leptomonas seymouri]